MQNLPLSQLLDFCRKKEIPEEQKNPRGGRKDDVFDVLVACKINY